MVGALERLEELLGLVYGRRLERNGIQPSFTLFIPWGMAEGYAFGRIFGVEMRPYAFLSPLRSRWQPMKMSWWQMCGRRGLVL